MCAKHTTAPTRLPEGGVVERWLCLFEGRTGSMARATFSSKEEAMEFAERHARTMNPETLTIEWDDANDETMSYVPTGKYWIARVEGA